MQQLSFPIDQNRSEDKGCLSCRGPRAAGDARDAALVTDTPTDILTCIALECNINLKVRVPDRQVQTCIIKLVHYQ